MTGELTKVEIRAFKDKNYKQHLGTFELPINPVKFSQAFKVSYERQQAVGAAGTDPDFKVTKPEELSLEFTLDGTGVVPVKGAANTFHKDVAKQVEAFLKLAYVMNSDTHKPNFLRLLWGNGSFGKLKSCFNCVLINLTIDYTLFAPDGKPLRAKLNAKFLEYIEEELRIKEEGKKSPDVTHVRTVRAGENLPLITQRIYGDQSYYLQVAKANGLINFRGLKTNTNLRFPPIDKTTL
ncbi:LysM peptidoglycan-binding domain-containing protein [Trichocoleus sp. FACHB-591]|uniref:CIS tube protein n=1 Tax=Trichocoleus sp. FACHB-591 TaxID=2692872 RepID=UPI0016863221|nr:LysM peptidoglycan-binding domain-containing protein [Trichocoleus sp. FACHB-591]MBD2095626.1 LysM peptidoglycan-binding domain-containing protein [Trichocoleus sp. FACHB-591]